MSLRHNSFCVLYETCGQLLAGVQSMQDVGVAPRKTLRRGLLAVVLVDLFINTSAIVLDMMVDAGHNRISCALSFHRHLLQSDSLLQFQQIEPFCVFRSPDWHISMKLHLVQQLTRLYVEEFSQDRGQKLPRVSASVVVTGISPVENARNPSLSIRVIDGVFRAEGIIEYLDCGGCF